MPNTDEEGRKLGSYEMDKTTSGLVQTEPGDSGSPIFLGLPWWHGSRKVLVSANSNSWTAPTMVLPGYSTSEQADAVRLNTLWLKARMEDPDADGVPNACDDDPAVRDSGDRTELCPAALGFPVGEDVEAYPEGSLMCPAGYVASGVRGRESAHVGLVDELAVRCTSETCFEGGACDTLWTDTYGMLDEPIGDPYTTTCPNGQWMTAIHGHTAEFNGRDEVISLGIFCSRPYQGWPSVPAAHGGEGMLLEDPYLAICPEFEPLRGLVAHSRYRQIITGMVPVCRESQR
jgi:hypothetical protein